MPEPAATRSSLNTGIIARLLVFIACASAALVSIQEQSATRMLLWPWHLLYWLGPLAAVSALIATLLDRDPAHPALPRRWTWPLALTALVLLSSTLLSPVQAQILPWAAWPLTLLALTVVLGRHLAHPANGPTLQRRVLLGFGAVGAMLSATSLIMLASDLMFKKSLGSNDPFTLMDVWSALFNARNSQPLGHVNYTAGSALLFLPALITLVWTSQGLRRVAWGLASLLCVGMFLSGGSRGGFMGLTAALGLTFILLWRTRRLPRWLLCGVIIAVLSAAWMHPTIKGRLLPPPPDAPINVSNEQRKTWLIGGFLAAADRPFLGWGTGSSPWVFTYYRGQFDYGPPTIWQLHSLPVQLLAEGGVTLLVGAAALAVLTSLTIVRRLRRLTHTTKDQTGFIFWPAAIGLIGYGVFSLTDYQLDLPIISAALATLLSVMVAADSLDSTKSQQSRLQRKFTIAATVAVAVVFAGLAWVAQRELRMREAMERGDWAAAARISPQNAALRIYVADRLTRPAEGQDPAKVATNKTEALRLLALNFNEKLAPELSYTLSGWILLPDAPAQAHAHFVEARLVYPNSLPALLGSSLASIGQGNSTQATQELVETCLSHPSFIASGWWQDPRLIALRPKVTAQLKAKLTMLASSPDLRTNERTHAAYLHALLEWIEHPLGPLDRVVANAPSTTRLFWSLLANPPSQRPPGLPTGLAAALAPTPANPKEIPLWITAIELAKKQPVLGGYAVERRLVTQRSPIELVHSALAVAPDSPWPSYSRPADRQGFARNHRQPRLYDIKDGSSSKYSIWTFYLLAPLWPDEYWIAHRHILKRPEHESLP